MAALGSSPCISRTSRACCRWAISCSQRWRPAAESSSKRLAAALRKIAAQIEQGRSLEEVLESLGWRFPRHVSGLIRAAARTGDLGKALDTFLSQQRTAEARELFNTHDDIQSFVSKVSVRFTNNNRAVVIFPSLVSGVAKATGRKKIIFEGDVSLTMEKQGDTWKIVEYSKKSI